MEKETATAILLMAGKGERFNSPFPKQFIQMGGQELFLYAARTIDSSPYISSIVFVVPKNFEKKTEEILKRAGLTKNRHIICGGNSRQESVFLALSFLANENIDGNNIVLIHDGDRPSISEKMISENIRIAREKGAAVTAIPASDSLAFSENGTIRSYLDRSKIYALQTPQTFRFSLLLEAENKAKEREKLYTDEGSLLLGELGIASSIVIGEKNNIKITEPFDKTVFLSKQNYV